MNRMNLVCSLGCDSCAHQQSLKVVVRRDKLPLRIGDHHTRLIDHFLLCREENIA